MEISNVKCKKPGTTERDLAIQNRKNTRLARCIQEAHAALGVTDPTVFMADVAGMIENVLPSEKGSFAVVFCHERFAYSGLSFFCLLCSKDLLV
jgi:hypothetical protein